MDALLFALALEVVLLQMRILESTTELRLRVQMNTKTDKAQRGKLVRDRHTVKDVIRRTLIEVVESGAWGTLQESVQALLDDDSYAVIVRSDHEKLRFSRSSIINEMKTKRKQWAIELQNADHKIAVVRDKIKNEQQNANARLCYVEKWLFARAESLDMQLDETRAPAPRADHEHRVHDELAKAYELQIKEREDSLEYWRQRYVNDTNKMEDTLTKKREELRVALARRQELQKLYDLHAGEMRAWLTFKSERAARLAREERLATAARRIQAWWRGVMVRRAIGAFRYLKTIKKSPSKSKKK
ncbi:dynein regulatory complex protein 9-like [Ostrinia furnacalis]|uniref:dynein regulatory complex protein 9-like n=1 Tax=Ostrinia furnacalis TaxID=93504 RepID=UPI00103BB8DF|nr:dynein regulatory complex protein 9-like [Ostrinia furnacalis]